MNTPRAKIAIVTGAALGIGAGVAAAVACPVSNEAAFVTRNELPFDGGLRAHAPFLAESFAFARRD